MRRVLLVLIALTVLVPSLGHAATLYRCGHGGALSDHCCCAPAQATHDRGDAAVRPGCCCETVHIAAARAPDRESPPVTAPPLASPVAFAPIAPARFSITTLATLARSREATAPPAPLFVVHCALLR